MVTQSDDERLDGGVADFGKKARGLATLFGVIRAEHLEGCLEVLGRARLLGGGDHSIGEVLLRLVLALEHGRGGEEGLDRQLLSCAGECLRLFGRDMPAELPG